MLERSMLEAVKELKEEYSLSSASAYYYLKSQHEYDELRNWLVKRIKEKGLEPYKPSLRELSNFCTRICKLGNITFNHFSGADGTFLYPFNSCIVKLMSKEKRKLDSSENFECYGFDYFKFCEDFYSGLSDDLKTTKTKDQGPMKADNFMRLFIELSEDSYPYFIEGFPDSRNQIPFNQIIPDSGLAEKIRDSIKIMEKERISIFSIPGEEFIKNVFHCIITLEQGLDIIAQTIEEEVFIYGDLCVMGEIGINGMLERSRRDQTRGYLQTERRIALAYSSKNYEAYRLSFKLSGKDPKKVLDTIIEEASGKLTEAKKEYENGEKDSGIEAEEKRFRKIDYEDAQYVFRILKSNKSWLEKVLSH